MVLTINNTATDWFFIIFLTLFSLTAVSCLLLAQFTVRRIEKEIKRSEVAYEKAADFGGSRIVTYAYAVLLPERIAQRLAPLIDATLIRSYATGMDWWRSLFFVLASHCWIGVGIIGGLFILDT